MLAQRFTCLSKATLSEVIRHEPETHPRRIQVRLSCRSCTRVIRHPPQSLCAGACESIASLYGL